MTGTDPLSPGAVARRLGIAVTTLRTWHQRYGLGPSRHEPGRHRRYDADDLARLAVMRRLTAQGMPPAEAARHAAGAPDAGTARDGSDAGTPRDGGGRLVAVGRGRAGARGVIRAAMRLDATGLRDTLASAVAARGVVPTWDEVLRPALVGVARRQAGTLRLVEVEHLIARCASEVLAAVPRPRPDTGRRHPVVLLACADDEQHSLPLEALAAALAEAGRPCLMLGARVPAAALTSAVVRTTPDLTVIWAQTAQTASMDQLAALRGSKMVAAAGPGWSKLPIPVDVVRPKSLSEGLTLAMSPLGRLAMIHTIT